ncbi:MAG: substrate-binding domain-containing protein [Oscillospiraceae bacterium]|nr:substrate-binding domain-containing protein [Oscillospiraceae bacterium]
MKKALSLILVLVMLMGLMAACGNDAETPAADAPAASDPAPVEPTPEEPADEPAEEPADEPAEEPAEEPEVPAVDLSILYEQDDSMINTYSLLAVNPEAPFVDADGNAVDGVALNTVGAEALANWLISEEAKTLAGEFGYAEYGEYLFYVLEDGALSTAEIPAATEETKLIRLSTTTSVNDSGLLGYLLPIFEEEYGYEVEVYSAGTGKSIANAKMGNADLIFVHSKKQEVAFVEEGFSYVIEGQESERLSFIYNFFVLCGPSADPAGVKDCATVKDAFAAIAAGEYPFVSRGDASGTHTKEISLWPEDLGITTESDSVAAYTAWYNYSNAGMGICLTMAEELGGYILSDKATYLTFRANGGIMD